MLKIGSLSYLQVLTRSSKVPHTHTLKKSTPHPLSLTPPPKNRSTFPLLPSILPSLFLHAPLCLSLITFFIFFFTKTHTWIDSTFSPNSILFFLAPAFFVAENVHSFIRNRNLTVIFYFSILSFKSLITCLSPGNPHFSSSFFSFQSFSTSASLSN